MKHYLLLGILLVSLALPLSANGDVGPNDSLLDPERIGEGRTYGNVTAMEIGTWPNISMVRDSDVYSFPIPQWSALNISIQKLDLDRRSITVDFYDPEGIELGYWSLGVSFPGESDRTLIENEGDDREVLLLVEGNGSYVITLKVEPLEEEPRHHENDYSWFDAPYLGDGSVNGSVSVKTGPAIVYYKVRVPENHLLDLSIEKTDEGGGTIYLETFERFESVTPYDIQLEVSSPGEIEDGKWENNLYYEETIIVRVYGEGNYTIEVDTSEEYDNLGKFAIIMILFLFIMVISVMIPLMAPFIMVIVIIIVILLVVKGSKKKEAQGTKAPTDPKPPRKPREAKPRKRSDWDD